MPAPDEVARQLQEWGIWDDGLSEDSARHRYVQFLGVTFGVAPEDQWPRLRRALLPFEAHLAST